MSFGDDTLDPSNRPLSAADVAWLLGLVRALGEHWILMLPRAEWEIGAANRDYISFVRKEPRP